MLPVSVRKLSRGYDPADALSQEFNRMFHQLWSNPVDSATQGLVGMYPVDIREDEQGYTVEAELPGFRKDEVDITLENGVLTITAERKPQETKGESHLAERRYTRVARSFTLPNQVNEQSVDASLSDGVLTLKLQKREEAKPRKIAVK